MCNYTILKYLVVPELYAKTYEKMAKIQLYKKRYNLKTRKIFGLKFDTTILKLVTNLYENFKFVSLELTEK